MSQVQTDGLLNIENTNLSIYWRKIETLSQVQADGLLNIMVSSLVERQAVEPEGALGCEVRVRRLEIQIQLQIQ